jgi:hypothetical protein
MEQAMTDPAPASAPTTARDEFLAWFEREKANGLKDIKFYPGNESEASAASFYQEVNAMNRAIAQGNSVPLTGI